MPGGHGEHELDLGQAALRRRLRHDGGDLTVLPRHGFEARVRAGL